MEFCRAQNLARRFPFFAKLDVRRFLGSIDHDRLLALLRRRFREKQLKDLLEHVIRFPLPGQLPGKGLHAGTLHRPSFAVL